VNESERGVKTQTSCLQQPYMVSLVPCACLAKLVLYHLVCTASWNIQDGIDAGASFLLAGSLTASLIWYYIGLGFDEHRSGVVVSKMNRPGRGGQKFSE
jgi:hypothetical protein